jgi:hypothetical protein
MAREIEFDATPEPKRKTGEAVVCSVRNARRTETSHHEWSRLGTPAFKDVLVSEIPLKLVQDHLFIWGRRGTYEMNITILSSPSKFDQVFFI